MQPLLNVCALNLIQLFFFHHWSESLQPPFIPLHRLPKMIHWHHFKQDQINYLWCSGIIERNLGGNSSDVMQFKVTNVTQNVLWTLHVKVDCNMYILLDCAFRACGRDTFYSNILSFCGSLPCANWVSHFRHCDRDYNSKSMSFLLTVFETFWCYEKHI